MSKKKVKYAVLVGLAFGGMAGVSHADIIYQDNFDGTAGTVNGRTPDQATGLDGGTASTAWNGQATTTVTAGSWIGVDIYLDTTGAAWKESWAINGTPLGTGFTFGTNPSIGDVIFGTNKLNGAVSNFSLTKFRNRLASSD